MTATRATLPQPLKGQTIIMIMKIACTCCMNRSAGRIFWPSICARALRSCRDALSVADSNALDVAVNPRSSASKQHDCPDDPARGRQDRSAFAPLAKLFDPEMAERLTTGQQHCSLGTAPTAFIVRLRYVPGRSPGLPAATIHRANQHNFRHCPKYRTDSYPVAPWHLYFGLTGERKRNLINGLK